MHIPVFSDYFVSRSRYNILKEEKNNLSQQILSDLLKKENELPKLSIPVAGLDTTDLEPTDDTKRKEYCIEVDNFFEFILRDKLKTSIADIRGLLSNVGMQEGIPINMPRSEYDSFLRGMEASMWKLYDWCLLMQSERKSYSIKQD